MKSSGKIAVGALLDLLEYAIIGGAVFLLSYIFIGQLLRVTGDSMIPNFHDGEQIIAEKVSIQFEELKRGDIVIFKHPSDEDKLIIKRIIGMPNESARITEGNVYINGKILEEPYLPTSATTTAGKVFKDGVEVLIPENSYMLLGDNRNNSTDSREWGFVKKDRITAKAFLVYFPLNKIRIIE